MIKLNTKTQSNSELTDDIAFPSGEFKVADKLNRTQEKLLQVLRESSEVTTAEMASALQMSPAGIRKNLYALRDGGYIERVGSDKSGRWDVLKERHF